MQKTLMLSTKQDQKVNNIMSKLYFSRTQDSYLKIYGSDKKYLSSFQKLLPSISKNKLTKIVQSVKLSNSIFKKYLQKNHITKLSFSDIVAFEQNCEEANKFEIRKSLQLMNIKTDANVKQLDHQIIRIGFMMILQKIQEQNMNSFNCQVKYLEQTIERQNLNLKMSGYSYQEDISKQKYVDISKDILSEEKVNGSFDFIGEKVRTETLFIDKTKEKVDNFTKKEDYHCQLLGNF